MKSFLGTLPIEKPVPACKQQRTEVQREVKAQDWCKLQQSGQHFTHSLQPQQSETNINVKGQAKSHIAPPSKTLQPSKSHTRQSAPSETNH
eukprot:5439762-Amphidinium_carterae.2